MHISFHVDALVIILANLLKTPTIDDDGRHCKVLRVSVSVDPKTILAELQRKSIA